MRAQEFLADLKLIPSGWCLDLGLAPSKANGLHSAKLGRHQQVLYAGGDAGFRQPVSAECRTGWKCHIYVIIQSVRSQTMYVALESSRDNNGRKGCAVWVNCPHCSLKIFVCQHEPLCIKFAPGYASEGEFMADGIH